MKTKLIDHPQYYLLVDEEADLFESDKGSSMDGTLIITIQKDWNNSLKLANKIIAHLPKGNAPKLEGVDLLPELPNDEEDVEQLAEQFAYGKTIHVHREDVKVGFIAGYKAAKQSEKKYSEEDMKNAIKFFKSYQVLYKRDIFDKDINHYLQSLSTTTPIDFVVEMEIRPNWAKGYGTIEEPKVINGLLQGKWKFK